MSVASKHPMPNTPSQRPFAVTLAALMQWHDVSQRGLARLIADLAKRGRITGDDAFGLTRVGDLLKGANPSPRNMEVLALALGEDPCVFLEYRQHLVRVRAAELADELAGELELDVILDALDRLKSDLRR